MNFQQCITIKDAGYIIPEIYRDERGYFSVTYNESEYEEVLGVKFVQDNESFSKRGVLRGLHYQIEHPQGKLVRVVRGSVWDVIVDIRRGSTSFGDWFGINLSEENRTQLWIPPGFAHGFYSITDAVLQYKVTDYRYPEHERCIAWNDTNLGIDWRGIKDPILSEKDKLGDSLYEAEMYEQR